MEADDRARALFENARRDRPARGTEERVLEACRNELARSTPATGARRIAIAAGALLALAAGAIVVLETRGREPLIAPTPERFAPSRASAPATPPQPAPAPLPSASAPPHKRAAPVATASSAALSLSEEVDALDRARSKLAGGDPTRALALLDEYQRAGGKRLHAEATLVRIEALARLGRRGEASALARRFLEKNPSSALADRAAAFAGLDESEKTESPRDSGGSP